MKVSGFTFVRNAVKFDYPVVEAITSVLPLCDEFIIALGNSDDTTFELISSINSPKIRIIHTVWNDALRKGGGVFAVETDKAFHAIAEDSDWAFYIQADEIVHEKYYDTVRKAMQTYKDDVCVDGLLFDYLHFYGSYDYVGSSPLWYRREVRIIRNDKNIVSYRDAQGFRKKPKRKLKVKHLNAYIYHYGWVRHPKVMQSKQQSNEYFNNARLEKNTSEESEFDYSKIDYLVLFQGTHPKVIAPRIEAKNWIFHYDVGHHNFTLKNKFKNFVEKWTGWRIGEFRNYKVI